MLVAPLAFGANGLPMRGVADPAPAAAWLCAALLAAPLGWDTGPRLLAVDRARAAATRAGSPVPLLRNLLMFGLQYGIAVGAALAPSSHALWVAAGAGASGLSIGYFAGWGLAFRRRYVAAVTPQSVMTSAQYVP